VGKTGKASCFHTRQTIKLIAAGSAAASFTALRLSGRVILTTQPDNSHQAEGSVMEKSIVSRITCRAVGAALASAQSPMYRTLDTEHDTRSVRERFRHFYAAAILLVVMAMPNVAFPNGMIAREAIIESSPPGAVIEPQTVIKAAGGGYILAGRIDSRQQAWAAKTNAAGEVLWSYVLRVKDELPIGDGAGFNGAVEMPDGSIFLCGNMSRPPGVYVPALLTHLDVNGHVLSERFLAPDGRTEIGSIDFRGCIRWGDGVAIIGHGDQKIPATSEVVSRFPVVEHFYWLVVLDTVGNVRLEKRIPTSFDGFSDLDSLVVAKDSSLLFSSWCLKQTELFRIGLDGALLASKKLAGQYHFVQSIAPDGLQHIFGYDETGRSSVSVIDDRLETTEHVIGPFSLNEFVARAVYEMPDNRYVLFGSAVHNWIGENFTTRVIYTDPMLREIQHAEFAVKPYYDLGVLIAASPAQTPGEFVAARSLLKHAQGADALVGAALDFVDLK
jgi:hypothetical protein